MKVRGARIVGSCVKTIWDCICWYIIISLPRVIQCSQWTRSLTIWPNFDFDQTIKHYRWRNFGEMKRSELLLFIRSQLQKAARFQQLYHWNLFGIATKHHHNSACLGLVCCDHIWYCQVMEGKAYCVIHRQGLFTIHINGQMDEQVGMEHSHRSL